MQFEPRSVGAATPAHMGSASWASPRADISRTGGPGSWRPRARVGRLRRAGLCDHVDGDRDLPAVADHPARRGRHALRCAARPPWTHWPPRPRRPSSSGTPPRTSTCRQAHAYGWRRALAANDVTHRRPRLRPRSAQPRARARCGGHGGTGPRWRRPGSPSNEVRMADWCDVRRDLARRHCPAMTGWLQLEVFNRVTDRFRAPFPNGPQAGRRRGPPPPFRSSPGDRDAIVVGALMTKDESASCRDSRLLASGRTRRTSTSPTVTPTTSSG